MGINNYRPKKLAELEKQTVYALDEDTVLYIENTSYAYNQFKLKICHNERNAEAYGKLENLTRKLSEYYNTKISISPADFKKETNIREQFEIKENPPNILNYHLKITINPKQNKNAYLSKDILSIFSSIAPLYVSTATLFIVISVGTSRIIYPAAATAACLIAGVIIGTGRYFMRPKEERAYKTSASYINKIKELDEEIEKYDKRLNPEQLQDMKTRGELLLKRGEIEEGKKSLVKKLLEIDGGINIEYSGTKENIKKLIEQITCGGDYISFPGENETISKQEQKNQEEKKKKEKPKATESADSIIKSPIKIKKEALNEPNDSRIGKEVGGKYELIEYLGGGLNGQVYRARLIDDKSVDDIVVKFVTDSNTITLLPKLRSLKHDNLMDILDWNLDEKYFVTKYRPCNLRELINAVKASKKNLSVPAVSSLSQQILSAISYSHENGIIHRDLKPENILLDKDGKVTVCDFGLAKSAELDVNSLKSVESISGTVGYLAPEQEDGSIQCSEKTDAYSIGLILHELLVKTRKPEPQPLDEIRPSLTESQVNTVLNLLRVDESSRFTVKEALEQAKSWDKAPLELKIAKDYVEQKAKEELPEQPKEQKKERKEKNNRARKKEAKKQEIAPQEELEEQENEDDDDDREIMLE